MRQGRLPDFVIIGAPRCGTTSLSTYLSIHPEVFVAPEKEVDFFSDRYGRGLDWYRREFAGSEGMKRVGEASPRYMFHGEAIPRLAGAIPNARLIAMLREPVARTYSDYWFRRSLGWERRPLDEVIDAELASAGPDGRRSGIVEKSTYLPALERVVQHFPRESLLVLLLEDLRADPQRTFASVCEFLDIDASTQPRGLGKAVNRTHRLRSPLLYDVMRRLKLWRRLPYRLGYKLDAWNRPPIEYPPIDPRARTRLHEIFEDPNAGLARWLGRDLSIWERNEVRP